jgi:hypothetical protein
MTEETIERTGNKLTDASRYRFMIFIGIIILIAMFLVGVSMTLYTTSGTAQLDLSRPGYQSVREQASRTTAFEEFPSTGPIDQAAIDEFRKLYGEKTKELTSVDSFGGPVMTDKALSIDAPK